MAPDVLIGSEIPRLWSPPLRRLTRETSAGWECIAFAEDVLGITLFPWQRWLLIHALELLEDGTYRFRTVVLLVGRQNGKSTLMQVLALWRMYVDGAPLVIGTAQNLDVAEEQWQGAVDMAESVPELDIEVAQKSLVNGKKFLRLVGGQRYKVAAASRRGGRGLSGDLVLLDELREHQTWDAWGAVTKTTMARDRAQVWAVSNAGDRFSIVLAHLRTMAHDELGNPDGLDVPGADEDLEDDSGTVGIFEWSAVPGCPIWDRTGWAQSNPSAGHVNGVSERAIASAAKTDPEDVFRTEVLCQWVDNVTTTPDLDVDQWLRLADPDARRGARPVFGVDVSSDRLAHIAVAWKRPGGGAHVMLADVGVSPLQAPGVLSRLGKDWKAPIMLGGSSLSLEADIKGGRTRTVSAAEFADACGRLDDLIHDGELRHGNQPELNDAIEAAKWRTYGSSGQRSLKLSDAPEVGPLAAVVRALHGLQAGASKPPPPPVPAGPVQSIPWVSRYGPGTVTEPDPATMDF